MKFKPSIKIGFILDGGLEKPDGVQQYILGLGQYFKSIGNEVRYLIAGPYPKEMSDVISLSRSWQVNSNGNQLTIPFPAKSKAIKEYLLQEKFDVLHVQTPYSPLMGGKVVLRADKSTAVIGTYHIVPNSRFLSVGNWLLGKYCIKSLKRIDRMISVSEAAKFIAKRDFSIDSVIIPNLVDFNKYNSASKNRNTNSLTILFLGRLVPRKGCLVLLKAIKRLSEKENIPKFNVVIAGSGPLEAKLKNYVKENNLDKLVKFIGYVNEVEKPIIYANSDITVFPSSGGESFGIVIIEALASGKSVVLAGDNAGYRSVLKDKPELLFDPSDDNNLADLIEFYLVNNDKREKIITWAGIYAKEFDIKVVGDKVLNVYNEAIAKKSKQIDN